MQAGMCIARGRATVRDAKGTSRSRRRGAADHRRLVARPRATHIPAYTLAPSPAGGGLRLGRKRLGRVPACMSIVFESTRPIFQRIRRIRRGCVPLKLFLYQPGTKKISMVRNTSIRGVQPVAHNTNFDSFLVVKKVLCVQVVHHENKETHEWICFVPLKLFLYQTGTKIVSIVRNTSIRGVQPVAHNTIFDSFLVVKKVLCGSSGIWIDLKMLLSTLAIGDHPPLLGTRDPKGDGG